jgi:hypothetical protein
MLDSERLGQHQLHFEQQLIVIELFFVFEQQLFQFNHFYNWFYQFLKFIIEQQLKFQLIKFYNWFYQFLEQFIFFQQQHHDFDQRRYPVRPGWFCRGPCIGTEHHDRRQGRRRGHGVKFC